MTIVQTILTIARKITSAIQHIFMHVRTAGNKFFCKTFRRLYDSEYIEFWKTFLRSPRRTGAVCPSGKRLALALINKVPDDEKGIIIDLGAGTGRITAQLLSSGVDPERIVAVEYQPILAFHIKNNFPSVHVMQGDAANLGEFLDKNLPQQPVCAIISSLPFQSLPESTAYSAAATAHAVLKKRGGIFIQFSYVWWTRYALTSYDFIPIKRQFVLWNIPPAITECYFPQQQ